MGPVDRIPQAGRNPAARGQPAGVLAAALFDVDGTLADTTALIREAITQILQEEGISPTWEEIRAGWSLRAADRMQLWVRDRARAEMLAQRYVERYLALQDALIRPYPGMAETLARLAAQGVSLGVVTSKRRASALATLGAFELERYFRVIVTEDDVATPKPDPVPLLLGATRLGAAAPETVMVGDGDVDIRAGKAAGMRTVGALWGTIDPEALQAAHPTWVMRNPTDLLLLPWQETPGGAS